MRTLIVAAMAVLLVAVAPTPAVAGGKGTVEGNVSAKPKKYKKNVVVYLENAKTKASGRDKSVTMDQRGMVFIPHVMPVVKGTTVKFLNSDKVRHNVFSPDHEKYNLGTWPKGESRAYKFKKTGVYAQLCNIHPEMEAYVVVLDTPYSTVSGKDGSFTIKNVPAGKYTLKVWSQKRKAESISVTVTDGKTVAVEIELTR